MDHTVSAYAIRKIIINESKRAGVGHIASALSIADIMAVLYEHVLRKQGSREPLRDRFILSKGHAVLCQYAALYLKGILSESQLHQYCADDSLLSMHPEHKLTGIEFSTGSLGHGLAYGAGMALAGKLKNMPFGTFVLLSDAECNEGSVWETALFAAQQRLSNLTVIIDYNHSQALGRTEAILNLSPFADKWTSFGWDAVEVNGHDEKELQRTLTKKDDAGEMPRVVIAHTILGKGVSFMENDYRWHYLPLSDENYRQALHDIEHLL